MCVFVQRCWHMNENRRPPAAIIKKFFQEEMKVLQKNILFFLFSLLLLIITLKQPRTRNCLFVWNSRSIRPKSFRTSSRFRHRRDRNLVFVHIWFLFLFRCSISMIRCCWHLAGIAVECCRNPMSLCFDAFQTNILTRVVHVSYWNVRRCDFAFRTLRAWKGLPIKIWVFFSFIHGI